MTDITVRPLGEDDWEDYRSVRLAALRESPEAFVATVDEEEAYDEDFWRERMQRSARLVAERDGQRRRRRQRRHRQGGRGDGRRALRPLGAPRGPRLGRRHATRQGRRLARGASAATRHLVYWVGTENGRAVAFASGMGFRPTDYRRPMGVVSEEDGEEEIAMVLPLG